MSNLFLQNPLNERSLFEPPLTILHNWFIALPNIIILTFIFALFFIMLSTTLRSLHTKSTTRSIKTVAKGFEKDFLTLPSKINSLFLYLAFHPISGSLIFLIVNAFIADNVDPSIWSFLFSTFILSFFSATSVYSQHPDKESYLVKVKSTYLWTNIIGSVLTLAAFF